MGVIMPPGSMAVWRLGRPGDKPDSSATVREEESLICRTAWLKGVRATGALK